MNAATKNVSGSAGTSSKAPGAPASEAAANVAAAGAAAKKEKKPGKSRIYLVKQTIGDKTTTRLLRAVSQGQVKNHLTQGTEISMATADDVVQATADGAKVEEVK